MKVCKVFSRYWVRGSNEVVHIYLESLPNQNDEDIRGKMSASTATSSKNSSRRRKATNMKVEQVAERLGNLAEAIKSLNTSIDENDLYQQVMTIGDDFHGRLIKSVWISDDKWSSNNNFLGKEYKLE